MSMPLTYSPPMDSSRTGNHIYSFVNTNSWMEQVCVKDFMNKTPAMIFAAIVQRKMGCYAALVQQRQVNRFNEM